MVGYKKSLVFYEKNARDGSQGKTNWLTQEYTAKVQNTPSRASGDMKLDDLVLCKIYQTRVKPKNNPRQDHGEEEPDETGVNPYGVDNMLNDAALPQGVDVESIDFSVEDCVYGHLVYNMAKEMVPNAADMHNDVVPNVAQMYDDMVPNVVVRHNDVVPNAAQMSDHMVPNTAHLHPHFNQSVSSYAYNSCADLNFGPDFVLGEKEHVKSCDSEVEHWIDRAQLNTSTYGELSNVMFNLLWSKDVM
ncbi:unnamed protein product [Ilex paraguariensis]|uniref:NAC domain-containing protein n=1 Tax=Ilex paraguariensis TaxID=185542 RepID=A0ABC8UCV3_9AQUA